MAVSNAEKQARWRTKRNTLAQSHPNEVERVLLQEVERCERGELSDAERVALADKLMGLANDHLWRAQELARTSQKVRYGRIIS
jgi:hypothetical protein